MSAVACAVRRDVDDHFRGAIDPARERAMRGHLASCTRCRERYARRALFAKLDPDALRPEERMARALGLVPRSGQAPAPSAAGDRGVASIVRRFAPEAALVLAAAACVLLLLRAPAPSPETDGFASRGGVEPAQASSPVLFVHRMAPGTAPTPATDTIRRDDELAFAYENPEGKPWLAIFAVDEHGRVYWFHPAWTDATEDPPAIHAETTPGVHELPEAVRHRFEGERLDVHALFLDKPLTVRQIEAELGRSIPGDRVLSFVVLP
jgi:hypothetical protein